MVHNTFLERGTGWKHRFQAILKISLGFGQFAAKNDQIWAFGIGKYIIALVLLTISYILTTIEQSSCNHNQFVSVFNHDLAFFCFS